jgi:hypothetical protein
MYYRYGICRHLVQSLYQVVYTKLPWYRFYSSIWSLQEHNTLIKGTIWYYYTACSTVVLPTSFACLLAYLCLLNIASFALLHFSKLQIIMNPRTDWFNIPNCLNWLQIVWSCFYSNTIVTCYCWWLLAIVEIMHKLKFCTWGDISKFEPQGGIHKNEFCVHRSP